MILPRVLSSHEEATVRCAKARPGSNSSAGSKAPVRLKTSGPHVLASLFKFDPVFIDRCDAEATCRTHPNLVNAVTSQVRLGQGTLPVSGLTGSRVRFSNAVLVGL